MKTLAVLLFCISALSVAKADVPPINTPATTDYFPGKFIWGDLFTDDPAAAQKFYVGLFGWTATTVERTTSSGSQSYVVLSVDGRSIAGIRMRPAKMKDEVHGKWIGYISVSDVAQTLGTATAGGGKVILREKEWPARGTQAVFCDPEGAMLGVMHSNSGDPGEYLPGFGDWTWAELFARDPSAAGQYYHSAIGYDCIPDTRTEKPNHFILVSGGYSRASVAAVSSRPKAHPTWLLFVRVASVKDAVAKAVSLGGRALVPPSDAPTQYWRAVIEDPAGAHIGVVELEETAAAKDQP